MSSLFMRVAGCTLLLGSLGLVPALAATQYQIILANPQEHLAEVHVMLPPGSNERELQLPVWNALYQVRDFAQYVNWIRAKDRAGRALRVRALDSSLWQITGAKDGAICEYEIYLNSPGPFGAQLNPHHAFLNLAQLLAYPTDARAQDMTVSFAQLPPTWLVATPLKSLGEGRFSAENYDQLVDSPIELGTFQESNFDEGGAHYRVIIDAEASDYDLQSILSTLHKLVATATHWMSDRPFEQYMFLYHFPKGPAGGGMEHADSTAIDINADVVAHSPESLASLTSHEFFHLWNVKRIRPEGIEPIDYTKQNLTRALWFSEGCTSAAADLIELRGGFMDEAQFEKQIAAAITELQNRPAHLTQSAEDSSLNAWLEGDAYYRRPERSVSYYNKGELLGTILDLAVREASGGKASLREVFQWLNENYARKRKPFPDSTGVLEAASAVSHADFTWFFEKFVQSTDEIPWNDFFRGVGLRVIGEKITSADASFSASRNFDGPMTVGAVSTRGAAEKAGLRIDDIILAINGKTAGQDSADSLAGLNAGDEIRVKVRGSRGSDIEMKWKLGSREQTSYQLKDLEQVSPQQTARRAAWLKGEAE